jgi:hypothetical protein
MINAHKWKSKRLFSFHNISCCAQKQTCLRLRCRLRAWVVVALHCAADRAWSLWYSACSPSSARNYNNVIFSVSAFYLGAVRARVVMHLRVPRRAAVVSINKQANECEAAARVNQRRRCISSVRAESPQWICPVRADSEKWWRSLVAQTQILKKLDPLAISCKNAKFQGQKCESNLSWL